MAERMTTPWVTDSAYAFLCLIKRRNYSSIILRKIRTAKAGNGLEDPKVAQEEDGAAAAASGTKPALDIEIVIEHRHKNHPLKFAELMNTYF